MPVLKCIKCKKEFEPYTVPCPVCNGTGFDNFKNVELECMACKGSGIYRQILLCPDCWGITVNVNTEIKHSEKGV